MGKTLGGVGSYLGRQLVDPIKTSINPFDTNNWRTEAADATNTDPGNVVRNVAGDNAANTLHGVVNTVAPAILDYFLSPAAGAAFTAVSNYGNGGSFGSSLGKGAVSLGESYAGNAIGGLASGGGSSSFDPSSLGGSGSSGTFGGGAKDFGNLFKTTPAITDAAASLSSPNYSDISNSDISNIGSNIGTNAANTTTTASDLANLSPRAGTAATGASNVANSNNLLGNIGFGRALTGVAGGLGQAVLQNQATADQLKAIKGQQQNLTTFDPSGITKDPGYQFQYDQGLQGLQRQLAAAGGTQSGGALKAATQYGQNYANNAFDDYYNRWAANTGANNQLLAQKGNIQSSGLLGQGTNFANTLNGIYNPNQGFSLGDLFKQRVSGF